MKPIQDFSTKNCESESTEVTLQKKFLQKLLE